MKPGDPISEVIVTRCQRLWLRSDGHLQAENISGDEVTLEDAQAIVAACRQLAGGRKRGLFIDTSQPAPLSAGAQAYYTSPAVAEVITAIGLLAPSWVGRMIGNFVLSRQRSEVRMRLFEDEVSAVTWLDGVARPLSAMPGQSASPLSMSRP